MVTKRKTNTQFVRDMMEYSDFGALAQVFILDAIYKFSESIAHETPKAMERAMKGSFVSAEAWHGVAKEIHRKLNERYPDMKLKPKNKGGAK